MQLLINGEVREVADGVSLMDLVAELKLAPERVAVELNQNVVRRIDWDETKLEPDDRIEIVHFVGGGAAEQKKLATDLHRRTRIKTDKI